MALRLPDHSHCENCGDPVPFGEMYCCDECRTLNEEEVRKEKKREYLMYISVGVILVAVTAISYLLS